VFADESLWRRVALNITYVLMMLALWAITHYYRGFARDGQLYAVQALARVHPSLRADLYLQNISQDQFTFFSPLYASFIKVLGLRPAEMLLFILCTAGFLAAAWALARTLSSANNAWLSVVLLIVTVGHYGSSEIFNYSENYLSARSLGEALTVTALASYFAGARRTGLFIGVAALFVHPLMALPGVLLLVCLSLTPRVSLVLAAAGLFGTLAFALTAASASASGLMTIMDPAWLEVVRERSQFLFLRYWDTSDWETAARPFVCLTLAALVLPGARTRQLCLISMLVGVSGLALCAIAGTVGPVAILVQGQAWRWMWVTTFISVLLLAPTVVTTARDDSGGPMCATLLVLGWTYSGVNGLACVDAALLLWLLRSYISSRAAGYLKWAAVLIWACIGCWIVATSWSYFSAHSPDSSVQSVAINRLREAFGLGVSGALLAWFACLYVGRLRSIRVISCIGLFFLAAVMWILPDSLRQLEATGSETEIRQFSDWRAAIPPTSNVLLLPTGISASFMWFTLERPSYLSVGQSAGVVFSRATSLEVRRRADMLSPLASPDWKILTSISGGRSQRAEHASSASAAPASQPLTRDLLVHICGDTVLDFVIARENVGYQPLQHTQRGSYKDWNLYDCRRIRLGSPAA